MRVARTVQGVHWGPVSLHSHDAASGRSTSWLVSPPSDADSCQHRRMSPPYWFSPFGVCTKAALVRAGMSRWQISEMYAEGSLIRLRPGWYAEQHADEAVRQAVHDGGVLSGLHRLRLLSRDVWLPPHAQRHMFAQQSHRCPGWQLHRKPRLSSAETQFGVVPPWIALRHGLTRQSLEQSVAVVDSLARVCAASFAAEPKGRCLSPPTNCSVSWRALLTDAESSGSQIPAPSQDLRASHACC